jgi:hypothetical protein
MKANISFILIVDFMEGIARDNSRKYYGNYEIALTTLRLSFSNDIREWTKRPNCFC